MGKTRAAGRMALLAVASPVALVVPGMHAGRSVTPAALTSCMIPHGAGPGYDASITNRQDGRTVCVSVGERLLVSLSAPTPTATPWQRVHVSPSGVLRIAPLPVLLPRGATATNFVAIRRGAVQLSSARPACTSVASGSASCAVLVSWRATVVVGATRPLIEPGGSGVYGVVSMAPTCPVERVGHPCPPKPVEALIDARNRLGALISSTRTDRLGHFALSLRPGTYLLTALNGGAFPRCPTRSAVVGSGEPVRVDISCDTGIR